MIDARAIPLLTKKTTKAAPPVIKAALSFGAWCLPRLAAKRCVTEAVLKC